ncbi:4Fe-4S dicluster domain-containing protein [Anaeromicropila herbilytica]|uniref:(4Fe-4S)-binding protein n=1 Tax=Anaeromicropila herbilytica TaxID=2785025 RepID=A0A7R7IE13_9FIRM|nr:4Fe-4S dicluster domain-containing protein [Anaeromicropila herbilytica]BCN31639.1 (4Fe-4S)-binding protein [Anaeromicropila herbilytica]
MKNLENMTEDQINELYVKLRDRMNTLSFGYCPTESGTEFVLLKRFFSPADCYHWLMMPVDVFFTPDDYSEVSSYTRKEASDILEDMAHRGLLYRVRRGGRAEFRVMPVAHGVYEFNLDKVEPEWAMGIGKHMGEGLFSQIYATNYPFYRSVPINKEVVEGGQVLPYDDIVERLEQYDVFSVSPCMCRTLNKTLGAPSEYPMETCISCGEMAQFYIENKIGREISKEEVLEVLKKSVEVGMVIQTCSSKASEIICSCHSKACGILQAAKVCPGEAMKNISHYMMKEELDSCNGCGACAKRCPMESIVMTEGKPVTDASCLGCGQCVKVCPTNSRILVAKAEGVCDPLPETVFDTYISMQEYRRKFGDLSE